MSLESFDNFENNSVDNPEEKKKEITSDFKNKVVFNAGEEAVRIFQKHFEGDVNPVDPETVREIFYTFLEQMIANSKIYESKEFGVAFPVVEVDTFDVALSLYNKFSSNHVDLEINPNQENQTYKKEFIFNSTIAIEAGGTQFTFFEQVLHHILKDLPDNIDKIKNKKRPEERHTVSILGVPTTVSGTMNENFLKSIDNDNAFKKFGEVYAELVRNSLPVDSEEQKKTTIFFRGISMGANFATETANILIQNDVVTQNQEERDEKPFLQVRIDTPPGLGKNPSWLKRLQVPFGFFSDALYTLFTSSYVRATSLREGEFQKQIKPFLEERGIIPNMTEEQVSLKKAAIKKIVNSVTKGAEIPSGVKVTEIVGLNDFTTYSPSFNSEVNKQRRVASGTLGENIAKADSDVNRRRFGINSGHNLPNHSDSELQRLHKAAEVLESIKNTV